MAMNHEESRAQAMRSWWRSGRRGRIGLGLALALAGFGCGAEEGRPPTYPVRGEVQFKGQPAPGAFLVFHPIGQAVPGEERPVAKVQEDGSFVLTSHGPKTGGEGAPAGRYAVTVQWYRLVTEGKDVKAGPNVIPPRYSKPETTPLKVAIEAKENRLPPFEIAAK
jgi:hypothetical protein